MTGRFAPSPTGDLHLGSLRTALAAYLSSRAAGQSYTVRVEDLDHGGDAEGIAARQLADLVAVGIDWDGPVLRQTQRLDRYDLAIGALTAAGLTYPCYCSRAEIRRAVGAPHGTEYLYPGTCRELSAAEQRRRQADRPPALRFRAPLDTVVEFDDLVAGPYAGAPADVVLRRNDGAAAYNVAVVVDDAEQGITEVLRGHDLLAITPTHLALQEALGLPRPRYAHVALVVGRDGRRLAKRDGAISLSALAAAGTDVDAVRAGLLTSLGVDRNATPPWTAFDLAVERNRGGSVPVDAILGLATP